MGDQPFQPTLLSLQDMLNLDDDDNDWDNNPYSISHVFNSLLSPTRTSRPPREPEPPVVVDVGDDLDFLQNPFFSPPKPAVPSSSRLVPASSSTSTATPFPCASKKEQDDDVIEVLQFLDVDVATVKSEPIQFLETAHLRVDREDVEAVAIPDPESILPSTPLTSPQHASTPKKVSTNEKESPAIAIDKSPVPTLVEVVVPGSSKGPAEKSAPKTSEVVENEATKKAREDAIDKLDALIWSLKRYSKVLGDFLDEEGDLIMTQYTAQNLGVFDDDEVAEVPGANPLRDVHSMTRALVDHAKGQTPLASLPPRKSVDWKSSELVELQKSVVESVIARRVFMLHCRYTQLLTEMGFDAEDLEKLRACETIAAEKGLLKILINDHNFFSQLKHTTKQPIKTVIIRNQHGTEGIPRVISLPQPELLVEEKWKAMHKIRREITLSTIEEKDIDWLYVMKKMHKKFPYLKLNEETCQMAYYHFFCPRLNKDPWSREELIKLRQLRERFVRVPWTKIAEMLETRRSSFSCFVKYKAHCLLKENDWAVSRAAQRLINKYFYECGGNIYRMDCKLAETLKRSEFANWMVPKKLVVVCKKYFNPRSKKGRFSVVEDALLLVVMEKYRGHLLENDGKLDPVGYALPWRYVSFWKARLGNLLTQIRFTLWSLSSDQLLLNLVQEHGPNYKIIQRHFPLKNRKQCRERYLRLQKIQRLATLEDYHLLYRFRKKEIDLERLNEVAKYLEAAIRAKLDRKSRFIRYADLEFLKMRRPPSDSCLQNYLLTFPVKLLQQALLRLSKCLIQIMDKVDEHIGPVKPVSTGIAALRDNLNMYNIDLTGFNRRSFNPNCPVSVGSALQIRNAKLLPPEAIKDLKPFEQAVYESYRYFSIKGKMKLATKRAGIPSLAELRKLPSLSKILQPVSGVLPVKPSKKFQHLPCPPSLIVAGRDLITPVSQEELVHEFQERKKGGRRKGKVRKKTSMKEQKRMAAMTRWRKEKPESYPCSPYSCDSSEMEMSYPATPLTPGSGGDVEITSVVSGASSGMLLRNAAMGLLSDHAYIAPMTSPAVYSSLPLPQLFSKICEVQFKHEPGTLCRFLKEEQSDGDDTDSEYI